MLNKRFLLVALILILSATISAAFAAYIDHSSYSRLLNKHLSKDGNFDYEALKESSFKLKIYLKELAGIDKGEFAAMSKEEKTAIYINAYNVFTIAAIIDHYPVKSIKKIRGVWNKLTFVLAGDSLTLNNIEHDILRKEFRDPRIHFALVCASKGCPELRRKPFTKIGLDSELDYGAAKFINNPGKVRLDKDKNILYLSPIFKWFKDDFLDVREFVGSYLGAGASKYIRENKPKIKYLKYSWSLNEKSGR